PETMDRRRRSLPATAGRFRMEQAGMLPIGFVSPNAPCVLALMLRSVAARTSTPPAQHVRLEARGRMHWLLLILRGARTRVRSLPNVFGVRAPQDEDVHRVVHSSRFQTAHLVLATRWRPRLATFASLTPNKGGRSAERRSGARRNTRGACHLASK